MIKKKERKAKYSIGHKIPPLSSPLYLYLSLPSADIFFNNIEKYLVSTQLS